MTSRRRRAVGTKRERRRRSCRRRRRQLLLVAAAATATAAVLTTTATVRSTQAFSVFAKVPVHPRTPSLSSRARTTTTTTLSLPQIVVQRRRQQPLRTAVRSSTLCKPSTAISSSSQLQARKGSGSNIEFYDEDEYEYEYDDEEEGYYEDDEEEYYFDDDDREDTTGLLSSLFGITGTRSLPDSVGNVLLAGTFVLGIGLGVTIDSQVNTNPKDLASRRDAIDQAAPNPALCAKLGASAMAFDQRVFVSFNPFNVYVSQADVKPACVLRDSNVVPVLKSRGLINDDEVRSCKNNMNTWAFVGDLQDRPQLSCVYKSQDAQNEFLSDPKFGVGEDYLKNAGTGKVVKGGITEAQKELIRKKQAAIELLRPNDDHLDE